MQVDEFIEICGWTRPRAEAEAFLRAANNDVALAVALFFDTHEPNTRNDAALAAQLASSSAETPETPAQRLQRNVEYERVPSIASAVEYSFNAPLKYAFAGLGAVLAIVQPAVQKGSSFYVSRVLSRLQSAPPGANGANGSTGPVKPFVFPEMKQTSYPDVISKSKTESKYVVAVLYSSVHETRLSALLTNLESSRLRTNERVIIWFCDVLNFEGASLASALNVPLPTAVVLAQYPKNAAASATVTGCLLKTGLDSSVDALVERAIQQHAPIMDFVKQKTLETNADRAIRQQQDDAYAVSLAKDRERDRKREMKKQFTARVLSTYTKYFGRDSLTHSSDARVSLRFPDGQRLNARLPASAPVRDLYDIAYTVLNKISLEDPETTVEPATNPDPSNADPNPIPNDEDAYKFQLVSPVARAVLHCSLDPLNSEPAVYPSGVLMIDTD